MFQLFKYLTNFVFVLPLERVQHIRRRLDEIKSIRIPENEAVIFAYSEARKDELELLFKGRAETKVIEAKKPAKKVSLIATCKNEAGAVEAFFEGLKSQTIFPDEVVICDGGSTDGTIEKIKAVSGLPFGVRFIERAGANIAEGRNAAIRESSGEILVVTDFGAKPAPDFISSIISPFAFDETLELSMGWYDVKTSSMFSRAVSRLVTSELSLINPKTFLPSSRSVAFSREAFDRAGGYPEHLTLAGEDTLFDYKLKQQVGRVCFVPDAKVTWFFPKSLWAMCKMIFNYARGDAEAKTLFWEHYLKTLEKMLGIVVDKIFFLGFFVCAFVFDNPWLFLLALLQAYFLFRRTKDLVLPYGMYFLLEGGVKGKIAVFYAIVMVNFCQACGFLRGLFYPRCQ